MAEQEFLASFGVQIDESGLNRLQRGLHRRDAAESPGPGFRPDRDQPDLYASGHDDYGAVMMGKGHRGLFP